MYTKVTLIIGCVPCYLINTNRLCLLRVFLSKHYD